MTQNRKFSKRIISLMLSLLLLVSFVLQSTITVSANSPSHNSLSVNSVEKNRTNEEALPTEAFLPYQEVTTSNPPKVEQQNPVKDSVSGQQIPQNSVSGQEIFHNSFTSERKILKVPSSAGQQTPSPTTVSGQQEPEYQDFTETVLPQVTILEAFDKYLSLRLSVPENISFPHSSNFQYQVTVTLNKETETSVHTFYFQKEEASSQIVHIEPKEGYLKENEHWTYDISVRLISTSNTGEYGLLSVTSSGNTATLNDVEVIPYYETKVTLRTKTKTIYTTQENVPIAQVVFSKQTTHKNNLTIEDLTYPSEDNAHQALTFTRTDSDSLIYASATGHTALGKHTIRVTADAAPGMIAASAIITVTVVQGIEEGMLSLDLPSLQYYKEENKALSFTAKAVYTKDPSTDTAAKKKAVSWEILSSKGNKLQAGDQLFGYLSVKNGKVTLNKNYQVSDLKEENCFYLKLQATDFADNTVCVYSELIEITNQMITPGEAAIVKIEEDGSGTVTARSNSSITSDRLGRIIVLKKDAPLKDSYTREELENYCLPSQLFTYKSSNNALKIEKDGSLLSQKPVKNATITVTMNDNSWQKIFLKKLSVTYTTPAHLGLKIEELLADGSWKQIGEITGQNMSYNINASTDTRLRVTVMQQLTKESSFEEINSHVNYSLSVKNGNLIKKSGSYHQIYELSATKSNLTLTLKDKAAKTSTAYTIINNSFPGGKAPKLTASGKLQAISYEKDQALTYTLKKNGKFAYDSTDKHVLIAVNNAHKFKNEKNIASYTAFEAAMGGLGYFEIKENKFSLNFHTDSKVALPAGTYKLWFTFGTLDSQGEFSADTAMTAVSITVKKVNFAKGSYKPANHYQLSAKESCSTPFKGQGKYFLSDTLEFTGLKNANIKGRPNAFTQYFEIHEGQLKLKDNLSDEQLSYLTDASAKNDLTGYLDYQVFLRNSDGSYSEQKNSAKITVTVKDTVRKFIIKTVNAKNNTDSVITKVLADSKEVNILYAYVTKGNYTISSNSTSTVVFSPKTEPNKPVYGTNNLTVYVVPEGAYPSGLSKLADLKNIWDKASENEKAQAEANFVTAIQKYGIKVTAKVVLPTIENSQMAQQVVKLVNKERAKNGLNPLSTISALDMAAFLRAKELPTRFSHTRPDGSSCFTILGTYGIAYRSAGENIAMGQRTPEEVVNAWMNSPGHRANILGSSFTHIGVGCYEVNGYYHWVQLFIAYR